MDHTRTQFGRKALSVAGPDVWDSLPQEIRLTENFATFKKELKTLYLTLLFPNFNLYQFDIILVLYFVLNFLFYSLTDYCNAWLL